MGKKLKANTDEVEYQFDWRKRPKSKDDLFRALEPHLRISTAKIFKQYSNTPLETKLNYENIYSLGLLAATSAIEGLWNYHYRNEKKVKAKNERWVEPFGFLAYFQVSHKRWVLKELERFNAKKRGFPEQADTEKTLQLVGDSTPSTGLIECLINSQELIDLLEKYESNTNYTEILEDCIEYFLSNEKEDLFKLNSHFKKRLPTKQFTEDFKEIAGKILVAEHQGSDYPIPMQYKHSFSITTSHCVCVSMKDGIPYSISLYAILKFDTDHTVLFEKIRQAFREGEDFTYYKKGIKALVVRRIIKDQYIPTNDEFLKQYENRLKNKQNKMDKVINKIKKEVTGE